MRSGDAGRRAGPVSCQPALLEAGQLLGGHSRPTVHPCGVCTRWLAPGCRNGSPVRAHGGRCARCMLPYLVVLQTNLSAQGLLANDGARMVLRTCMKSWFAGVQPPRLHDATHLIQASVPRAAPFMQAAASSPSAHCPLLQSCWPAAWWPAAQPWRVMRPRQQGVAKEASQPGLACPTGGPACATRYTCPPPKHPKVTAAPADRSRASVQQRLLPTKCCPVVCFRPCSSSLLALISS